MLGLQLGLKHIDLKIWANFGRFAIEIHRTILKSIGPYVHITRKRILILLIKKGHGDKKRTAYIMFTTSNGRQTAAVMTCSRIFFHHGW